MSDPTESGWTIDSGEVVRAASRLGMKMSIDVLWNPEGAPAHYTGIKDGRHQITIDGGLLPAVASWSILHEVAHASQCERMGVAEYAAYGEADKLRAGGVHDDAVLEIEANAMADWLHRRYQPAVKAQVQP